jgi:hypothetical protein
MAGSNISFVIEQRKTSASHRYGSLISNLDHDVIEERLRPKLITKTHENLTTALHRIFYGRVMHSFINLPTIT